jgi:hypothetical protein
MAATARIYPRRARQRGRPAGRFSGHMLRVSPGVAAKRQLRRRGDRCPSGGQAAPSSARVGGLRGAQHRRAITVGIPDAIAVMAAADAARPKILAPRTSRSRRDRKYKPHRPRHLHLRGHQRLPHLPDGSQRRPLRRCLPAPRTARYPSPPLITAPTRRRGRLSVEQRHYCAA